MKSVTIIGSGNVATQLSKAFVSKGLIVDAVYSRNIQHAQILAAEFSAIHKTHIAVTDLLTALPLTSDLYVIAVADQAIEIIAGQLPQVGGLVVHTSGITALSVLLQQHKRAGVFYPLQTLTQAGKIDFKNVPLLIEATEKADENALTHLAQSLGAPTHNVTSEQRQYLHLAAVFVNNFTNHLYSIGEEILTNQHLPFDLLKPLITETAEKIKQHSPATVQTGPAKRNDTATIEQHLCLLDEFPEYRQLYQQLTESIKQSFSSDNKNA